MLLAIILSAVTFNAEPALQPPEIPWVPKAAPLSEPTGQILRVATVDELFQAAEDVRPGGTILLADGVYRMPRYFELHTDRVTLRSASGRRDKVILDGRESRHGELVGISRCSGVTIADLTIQNIKWNGFKINSDLGATRVTIRNCVIHNIWQRGVKGPAVPKERREQGRPVDCRIEHCLFYNDRPKRLEDDPADTYQGDYVGGIDIMCAKSWTICDNVFWNIHGRNRGARGAIFVWNESEDCVIERNVIVDCDAGICLGNSFKGPETTLHCTRCVVRNNFVTRCPENGILADYTRDCKIVQNTIHDPDSRLKRLIRLVHDNDGLLVANNLLSGPPIRVETTSSVRLRDNKVGAFAREFANAAEGNLHWTGDAALLGKVPRLAEASEDIDHQNRGDLATAGADEPR